MSQLPSVFKTQESESLPTVFGQSDDGSELIRQLTQKPVKPQSFMGVEGAAPTDYFAPDGRKITRAEWRQINQAPQQERGVVAEGLASFVRGIVETPKSIAKAAMTASGAPDSAREDLDAILPDGPLPSRDDTLSKVANFTGSFIPSMLQGGVGFGTSAYNEVYERTGDRGASLGAGVVAAAAGQFLHSNLATRPLLEKFGESGLNRFLINRLGAAVSGGTNVGIAASSEGFARAGGAAPHEVEVLENFLGGVIGHEVMGLPKALQRVRNPEKVDTELRARLTRDNLITDREAELVGSSGKKMMEIAQQRLNNKEVEVQPDGKITSMPDTITWLDKQRLGFNPVAIDVARQRATEGKEPLFVEPSRLAPSLEEVTQATSKLTKLQAELQALVQPTELTELGAPVTPRALLLRDVTNQIKRLGDQPSRLYVDQAKALGALAPKVRDVTTPIPETKSSATLKTDEILSPIDMRPAEQFKYPLVESDKRGYFKPADQLAKTPKVQDQIARIQRGTLERYGVLVDNKAMSPVDKIAVTQALDSIHAAQVEKALNKDAELSKLKATAKTRVAKSKLKAEDKTDALAQLDRAFESIASKTDNETARGLVDRLSEELKGAPQAVRELVLGNEPWAQVVGRHSFNEDWSVTEQKIRRQLVDTSLAKERRTIIEGLKILRDDARESFVKALGKARTPDKIREVAKAIDLARAVEQRRQDYGFLKRLSSKLEKNSQREEIQKLIADTLSPAPKAQGKKPIEKAVRPVLRFEGKDYVAEPGETNHYAMMDRVAELVPEAQRNKFWNSLDDSAKLFETNHGRVVDGQEAQRINKSGAPISDSVLKGVTPEDLAQKSTVDSSKPPSSKPVLDLNPNTGKTELSWSKTEKALDALSDTQVTDLANKVRQLNRRAAIERGLYSTWLKYRKAETTEAVTKTLRTLPERLVTAGKHLVKTLLDPVNNEGWIYQLAKSDKTNPLYKTFVGDFIEGQRREYQNNANSRRFLGDAMKVLIGKTNDTISGREKLRSYLLKPVHDKITRGEAINTWLVAQDPGRQDIHKLGVIKNGKIYAVADIISTLSPKDLEFARSLRSYFVANPFVEKAMSNFTLLNGYDVPRTSDHWLSSREPVAKGPPKDYGGHTLELERMADPLKAREDGVTTPYDARDVVSEFLRGSDALSRYAELGVPMFRAVETLYAPKVKEEVVARLGDPGFKKLQSHLSNVMHSVGAPDSTTNKVVTTLINNYALSRIALNVFSASKQTLDVMTFMADGGLSKSSILQAIKERAWLDPKVKSDMLDNDGLAWLRYHGSLLDSLAVTSKSNEQPSRLEGLKERSLFMQQSIDKANLAIAWRAAQLDAAKLGLKGDAAREKAAELFQDTVSRAQPTNNPLFEGELEIDAKRQPLLRGAMVFMRAPNRIYNAVRRNVVQAAQNPSPENLRRAGQAVAFGIIGNTLGILAINSMRRFAYNKTQDATDVATDTIDSLSGQFYLAAPAGVIVEALFNSKVGSDRLNSSPLLSLTKDTFNSVIGLKRALTSEGQMTSGPFKGEDRSAIALTRAADSAMSLAGGVSGMPIWALYHQAQGLYNWTRPQAELMTRFEQERRQLQKDGRSTSLRYQELTEAQSRIERLHRSRQAGLATASETQRAVEEELRRVVR